MGYIRLDVLFTTANVIVELCGYDDTLHLHMPLN